MRTAFGFIAVLLSLAFFAELCRFLYLLVLEFRRVGISDPLIASRTIDWTTWLYMACVASGCLVFAFSGSNLLLGRRSPAD
jgi:hypothetical protein